MKKLTQLMRALGGPRCPWCDVPSPHRNPHPFECPWYAQTNPSCQCAHCAWHRATDTEGEK